MDFLQKLKKDRDAYLLELKEKHPLAFSFYDEESNYINKNAPNFAVKETSKKPLTSLSPVDWSKDTLNHLLKRTRIGVTNEELQYFDGKSMEEVVDELLTETTLSIPVNDYAVETVFDPDVPLGEPITNPPYNNPIEGQRIQSLKSWVIKHLVQDEKSIHPMMWLFWHNHLVIEMWGVFRTSYNYNYLKMLHDLSLGNFKEMIKRITTEPSMLIYLNGHYNVKDAPDENYARELQELFCIGKGPNSKYTEGDVQAAAKVLTGWKVQWDQNESIFNPNHHDTSDKQFSDFYDNKVIEGKSGQDGALETDELIDMLFDNDETAMFICRKLYTFFVYAEIDDWAEENVIQPLATTFRDNNYEIKPVLQQLLTSEHFYDEINRGTIIKSPVDILIGFWRSAHASYEAPPEDFVERAFIHRNMLWSMANWGQEIGDPPNVAGWPAYYQVPGFDKSWVTTNTITRRISYTDVFVWWGFWSQFVVAKFDKLGFAQTLTNPADPNDLIVEMIDLFLGIGLEDSVKTNLKSILLSGQAEDYYWTNAWNSYIADPDNQELKTIVETRLTYFFITFFQLAEFQLK